MLQKNILSILKVWQNHTRSIRFDCICFSFIQTYILKPLLKLSQVLIRPDTHTHTHTQKKKEKERGVTLWCSKMGRRIRVPNFWDTPFNFKMYFVFWTKSKLNQKCRSKRAINNQTFYVYTYISTWELSTSNAPISNGTNQFPIFFLVHF